MSLRKQTITGVKWTSLATIITTISALLKISVLTRFLDKSDFGLMALVVFIIGFTNLFMDMGLTTAILHKQEISTKEYNSLYWINILFSILLFMIMSLLSPIIATFYSEPELSKLIPIMASTIIISGIGRQYKTIEQKYLNFKFIAIIEIIASISSLILAIILAIYDFGIYSLVYSAIYMQFISNFSFFVKGLSRIGLKLYFSFNAVKPFLKIGLFEVGGQVVNYINRDFDILIIGKLMGSEVLGGYSLAKELVRRPVRIVNPVITKVYSSILPKFQNDPNKLRFHVNGLLHNVSIINSIVYGLIAILAPTIIYVLYGSGFDDIYLIVVGFCFIMFLRTSGQIRILVITTGRTDYEFYWNILQLVLFPLTIFVGAKYSIYHIVLFIAVLQILLIYPLWVIFYKKLINLKLTVFLGSIVNPLSISLITFFIFFFTNYYFFSDIPGLIMQFSFATVLVALLSIYSYFYSEEIASLLNLKR